MAYLKEKGYEARAFYLNVLYVLFILLGSLFAATLNGEHTVTVTDGDDFGLPFYQACSLSPVVDGESDDAKAVTAQYTTKLSDKAAERKTAEDADEDRPDGACLELVGLPTEKDGDFDYHADQQALVDAQQTLFNIGIATAVVNALFFVHSVVMHWEGFGISIHFMAQPVISVINLGLFIGLIANLGVAKDLNEAANVENNVYFDSMNVFAIALSGLIISAADLLGSNLVIFWACRDYNCWSK